jgi:hypothetical protein
VIRQIRNHATYANVMATVAVFIAIGGTSYAAIALPRNSVGSKELKPRSVGSSELRSSAIGSRALKDRSIAFKDLAGATTRALAGVPGPPGPPGAPAVALRAAVAANGSIVAGNATGGGAGSGYLIGFGRSLQGCVPVATLARNDSTDITSGRVVVAVQGDQVRVETYDASGTPTQLPFNVIVAC